MNLADLRSRCKRRFRDVDSVIVRDADWDDHLNAAYLEFIAAADWPLLITSSDLSFASGTDTASLPTGVSRVLNAHNLTEDERLLRVGNWETIIELYPDETEDGTPAHYRVVGSDLRVFPIPDKAQAVRVHFYEQPSRLSADADTPVLPERYHEALVLGAVAAAHLDDGNTDQEERFRSRYKQFVNRARTEMLTTSGSYATLPRSGVTREGAHS